LNVTLIFLALLMAAVVWWLLKQSINVRPWASDPAPGSVRDDGVRSPFTLAPLPSVKLGLGVFLAVATSLFALFISAYTIRMEYQDWRPLTEPLLLWVNSGVLVVSSIFLHAAWRAAKRGDTGAIRRGIAGGGAFALAFIAAQLVAWNQLTTSGYLISGNPANAFFYLLTGMHGLHLLGGLVALSKTVKRAWGTNEDAESIELGVELCTVYWDYLLVVWLILFGLMLYT
jgi:cytochrome c oxidase subunit 3